MSEIKLNLEGIHLDMEELIKKYNGKIGSCSNSVEIQQIALFCQNNRNDYRRAVLMDMIKPEFAFAGLYPHVNTFSIESIEEMYKTRPTDNGIVILDYQDRIVNHLTEKRKIRADELSEMVNETIKKIKK
jgi:hypothetical protein